MTIESAIYSRLSGFAGLSALVSTRIYPNVLAQNATLPAVVYQRISAGRISLMGVDAAVLPARFQFTAWATGHTAAAAVRDQVRQALQRWSQTGPPVVQDTYIENEIDLFDEGDDGTVLAQLVLDALIWFEE